MVFKLIGPKLPKRILKEIESHCRIFLWAGQEVPSRKALVSWVGTSKGGRRLECLAVGDLEQHHKVWNLSMKADSMWVKWVHVYYFKRLDCWTEFPPIGI